MSRRESRRQGKSLEYVPSDGEVVVLRDESNLSAGGDSIDFTESAAIGFNDIAKKAIKAIPGLKYAGVDIITKDILQDPTDDNYVVTEVEFSPAPLSMFPLYGEPRDMAGSILDYYIRVI
jgi:D-alanine-D-alanine ligase-like ATP-grasp enzyme